MRIVTVTGLTKRFGEHAVLEGVCFELYEGEFLAVLGPNGAGKTTLLRLISGMLPASEGKVSLFGHPIEAFKHIGHLIGIVHQESEMPERLTVDEYLLAEARLRDISAAAVDEHIDVAGLSEVRARRLGQLSKGMRRRVAIVRALLHRPRILLLDEPTVGLDPMSRQGVWDYLRSCKGAGLTCLIVTHYLDEVEALCDKALLLRHQGERCDSRVLALRERCTDACTVLVRFTGTEHDALPVSPPPPKDSTEPALGIESVGADYVRLRLTDRGQWLEQLLHRLPTDQSRITGVWIEDDLLEATWNEFFCESTEGRTARLHENKRSNHSKLPGYA